MGWKQWPFRPSSLTEMIGPPDKVEDGEQFISLLVSGWCERLGRPLTVVEPVAQDGQAEQLELRRIDHINPREHFGLFCNFLRNIPPNDDRCQCFDKTMAEKVIRTAIEAPELLHGFAEGYPCWAGLIDQAAAVCYHNTPIAVVFSGQFLPDAEGAKDNIRTLIETLTLDEDNEHEFRETICALETRKEFVQRYLKKLEEKESPGFQKWKEKQPTVADLFLEVVAELQGIAYAQFQLRKSELENVFRQSIREMFPPVAPNDRDIISKETVKILDSVCKFCGTEYLALFVNPRPNISYAGNLHLLSPFAFSGVPKDVQKAIMHFNWRKARLPFAIGRVETNGRHRLSLDQATVAQLVRRGLGKQSNFFQNASILSLLFLPNEYSAVLIWGPFHNMDSFDLEQERSFFEEVSELITTRVLSSVQSSDTELRTSTWEEVATLVSHYSRCVLTPVSAGVHILTDFINGLETYSKEDALKACESLETVSSFIRSHVRDSAISFAAMSESVYQFTPASLSDIVDQCIALYTPKALEKSVTITTFRNLRDLPQVEVDVAKMRDALGYIIENAIKYSHDGKEVRIKGELSGSQVRVMIDDLGQGIPEGERKQIFNRGFQGDRSRKSISEQGEGMGLFHARLIVTAHRGTIWCDVSSGERSQSSSTLAGYRVQFTVEIPIQQKNNI